MSNKQENKMKETETKAIEFVKDTLGDFIKKFTQTRVRYEYDVEAKVHTIEVVPNKVYHLNEQYIDWEDTFTDVFITKFPDQNIGFISDDALVGIEKRNKLRVNRLQWTHEQLTKTRANLEWTESERRRLKEKSDRLRKELYQLKNKQS